MKTWKIVSVILLCASVAAPLAGQAKKGTALPEVVVSNGNMKTAGKMKLNGKEVDFVKSWSVYGNAKYSITKNAAGSYDVYTNGCFGGGFGVPKNCPQGYDYKLTITAKGKNLSVRTWSWVGYNPRSEHRRLTLPEKYTLTDTFKDYTFTFPCLPKEYYVVLWIDGEKTISNIKCELVPAKAKAQKTALPAKK